MKFVDGNIFHRDLTLIPAGVNLLIAAAAAALRPQKLSFPRTALDDGKDTI